jgi:hypothetical protein
MHGCYTLSVGLRKSVGTCRYRANLSREPAAGSTNPNGALSRFTPASHRCGATRQKPSDTDTPAALLSEVSDRTESLFCVASHRRRGELYRSTRVAGGGVVVAFVTRIICRPSCVRYDLFGAGQKVLEGEMRHKIEVFSSGCALCNDTIEMVRRTADQSYEVIVRNMTDSRVLARAKELGITTESSRIVAVVRALTSKRCELPDWESSSRAPAQR